MASAYIKKVSIYSVKILKSNIVREKKSTFLVRACIKKVTFVLYESCYTVKVKKK